MSAFLGPIHYWLYKKIQLQQALIEKIGNLANQAGGKDLLAACDMQYGLTETRPLEEVINTDNIHGWLQGQVSIVENKLAYLVGELLKQDAGYMSQLETLFYESGLEKRRELTEDQDAISLFGATCDLLLDGMPCDHAQMVLEKSTHKVVWTRNTCVHQKYWQEVGMDVAIYYQLREKWLEGFVSMPGEKLQKIDDKTYSIVKE